MILSDCKIINARDAGDIVIEPWDRACLGSNSYDVHLSPHVIVFDSSKGPIDAREPCDRHGYAHTIGEHGLVLYPHEFYLGATVEYTEAHRHVPFLEGKSSTGRLGISIHETAGKGDVGFCGHWTMEISVRVPVRVYAGMPIGQLIFHEVAGVVLEPYDRKASAKYASSKGDARPRVSQMHQNWDPASKCWVR